MPVASPNAPSAPASPPPPVEPPAPTPAPAAPDPPAPAPAAPDPVEAVWPPGQSPEELAQAGGELVIGDDQPELSSEPQTPTVTETPSPPAEAAAPIVQQPVEPAATEPVAPDPSPAPVAPAPVAPAPVDPVPVAKAAREAVASEPEVESPSPTHETSEPAPELSEPAPPAPEVSEPAPPEPPEPPEPPAPEPPATAPPEPVASAPAMGEELWRFPEILPGQGEQLMPIRNRIAYNDQGMMFATAGTKLAALRWNENGLEVVWTHSLGKHAPGNVVWDAREERVFVHSGDGQLHGLASSGETLWAPVDVGEPLGWAAPLVDRDGTVYVSSYTGGLEKIDFNGNLQRQFMRSRQKFDSTGVIQKGILYIGGEDGFVYAIDLSGRRGKNTWDHWEGQGKTEWFINSALFWSPQRRLIVAGRDEYLYAFHDTGAMDWRLHLGGQMLGSPVADEEGRIYVGLSIIQRGRPDRGVLVAVCPRSQEILWEYQTRGAVESTPVVGDDQTIYVGDNAGFVHAVDASGTCQWTTSVGAPVRSAGAIPSAGILVFGADSGALIGLRCSSKSV